MVGVLLGLLREAIFLLLVDTRPLVWLICWLILLLLLLLQPLSAKTPWINKTTSYLLVPLILSKLLWLLLLGCLLCLLRLLSG